MTHLVKCNKCGHSQRYLPVKPISSTSKKRCVYCGHAIVVRHHLVARPRP